MLGNIHFSIQQFYYAKCYKLKIFNEWMLLIFESDLYTVEWEYFISRSIETLKLF